MVGLVVVCNHTTARAVWGHAPLEIFGNLEAMKLLLIPFLGGNCACRRPDDRVSLTKMSNFSADCVIHHQFQLSDHSLISQAIPFADEACKVIF